MDARIAERVGVIADTRGVSRAQVALAWVLSKPAVTVPIIGASRPDQLSDLVGALEVTLDEQDIAELETAYTPHYPVGFA